MIASAKATSKTAIERHHYNRCFVCGERIYLKPIHGNIDGMNRMIAYDFMSNHSRHYCYIDPILVENRKRISSKHIKSDI